jgi:hypothetical protein
MLVMQDVIFAGNKHFPYTLRHDSGWFVHLQDVALRNQFVGQRLLMITQVDAVFKGLVVEGNNASTAGELVLVQDARLAVLEVSPDGDKHVHWALGMATHVVIYVA